MCCLQDQTIILPTLTLLPSLPSSPSLPSPSPLHLSLALPSLPPLHFLPQAGDLLNPPPRTRFQQAQLNLLDSVYNSKRKAPLGEQPHPLAPSHPRLLLNQRSIHLPILGSSHDQFQGLPSNMDLSKTVFGKATLREESAGSIVTPQKNSAEVEAEHRVGRELYKKVSIPSVIPIYLPPSSSPLSPILVISSSFSPSPLIPPPFSSSTISFRATTTGRWGR